MPFPGPPENRKLSPAIFRVTCAKAPKLLTAAGLILGIYIAASAPGADISGSLLCGSGDFLGLLLRRLFWGAAFLISEYVCGFFALGRLLVWAAPLICGLGTGAALAGAFTIEGMNVRSALS